jgi:probable O-glycosylation ligase (exosortase A-associated)
MRDLVLFGIIFALLPLAVIRPFAGVLLYCWISYMNPHRLTWGAAFDFPFAKYAAIATLLGFLVAAARGKVSFSRLAAPEMIVLLLLWLTFLITTFFAIRPDLAWPELEEVSKILLMTLLAAMLTTDHRRFRWVLLLIMLSIGFYGIKGGVFTIMSGGESRVYGPERSFIADNTALGLALTMVLPMLYYQAKVESDWRLKRFLQIAAALTFVAALFTYSRGAFIGLVVVLLMIALRMPLKRKIVVGTALAVLVPIGLTFVPGKLVDRVETIRTYNQDGSANARMVAWKTAWELAKARPWTGGGFQIIDDVRVAQKYNPGFSSRTVGVHSVYFEVMAENGFIAFALFVSLILFSMLSLRRVRKTYRKTPDHPYLHYANMLQAALLAYAASGAFLEFASFDLFYHLVALVVILRYLAATEPVLAAAASSDNKSVEATPDAAPPTARPRVIGMRRTRAPT